MVVANLEESKEFCEMVHSMACTRQEAAEGSEALSPTCTKWSQVPQSIAKDILPAAFPRQKDVVTNMTASKTTVLIALMNVDPDARPYAKNIGVLTKLCCERLQGHERPYAVVHLIREGKVEFTMQQTIRAATKDRTATAFFSMRERDGRLLLLHSSGTDCKLMDMVGSQAGLMTGQALVKSVLTSRFSDIVCTSMFKDSQPDQLADVTMSAMLPSIDM